MILWMRTYLGIYKWEMIKQNPKTNEDKKIFNYKDIYNFLH